MYEVQMPKLSDSMEEGKIIEWKVAEGDPVEEGQVIAEIESDKAVMELESFHNGVLAEIRRGNDSEVRVGEVIALIRAGDEEPAAEAEPEAAPEEVVKQAEPAPEAAKPERPATPPKPPTSPKPPVPKAPVAQPVSTPPSGVKAISPYARKLAADYGLDYSMVKGSGPDGRVVADDIEAAAKVLKPGARAPAAPQPTRPDEELPPLDVTADEADIEEMSFRLKTQALRVVQSKHVIPHFYITRGADVTALLERREELKAKHGATVTHLVMYACVRALDANPKANWSYDRGRIIKWKGIHLGLAVATDEGLTVAVVRNAQALSLPELIETSRGLVERARAGRLSAEERRHPSFTVTNLGMFDVEHFEPIINPPSSITLGVSSALPEAVIRGDAIHVGKVMKLTASCDHRIVDGATAAQFLHTLVGLLGDPDGLLGE